MGDTYVQNQLYNLFDLFQDMILVYIMLLNDHGRISKDPIRLPLHVTENISVILKKSALFLF